MSLFAALRRGRISHPARNRVNKYLVAALMVAMTAAVPAGTLTAHAASLNHSAPSAHVYAATAPFITLSKTKGPPSETFEVKGDGFAPNAGVTLSFQGDSIMINAKTSSSGTFTVPIIVPEEPGGKYTVSAQQTSGQQAQAFFTIEPGFSKLNPHNHSDVAPIDPLCIQAGLPPPLGHPLKVGAWGLPASVSYEVTWQDALEGNKTVVDSGNTTASGSFETSFQVPAEPGGPYKLLVYAPSQELQLIAYYYNDTYSCFFANIPGDGSIHYQWDGVGWDANSTVTFNFNGSQIQQATANTQGSFGTVDFTQACPPPGTYPGTISGTSDGGQPTTIPLNPPITVGSGC